MGDAEYRLVTDPSEGPKLFQIDVRVMSSGATAVLLTGIDCAERVVCHESVSFDLSEGELACPSARRDGSGASLASERRGPASIR